MIYVTPRCWRSILSASNSQSNGSKACTQDQSDLLKFKMSVIMGNKGDLSDFKCGTVIGLSAAETADLLEFIYKAIFRA